MTTSSQLEDWFSTDRMSTYRTCADPAAVYAWNSVMAAAYFEVIGHTEVLLRNFIADALQPTPNGDPWYLNPRYHFNDQSRGQVKKVRAALARRRIPETPGRVVAELSFDFWRFLLARRHQTDVWVDLCAAGLPHFPYATNRRAFEEPVVRIYQLRNRIAHHEPLVAADPELERRRFDGIDADLRDLTSWIDPEASAWIGEHSRVHQIRAQRP